jgi:hypothetical protein
MQTPALQVPGAHVSVISGGHFADSPVQKASLMAVSPTHLAARHTVPGCAKASGGHAALLPVHVSATSHGPAEARHTVVADAKPSGGHAALLPVHVSSTSQTPAEARHTVVAGAKASAGHAALLPVHVSSTSQTPAEARHTVVAGAKASVGHAALLPVHVSATSHGPAEARHVRPADTNPHVPFTAAPAATLHAWQSVATPPPQSLSQQTPSTQYPLTHSEAEVQFAPFAFADPMRTTKAS